MCLCVFIYLLYKSQARGREKVHSVECFCNIRKAQGLLPAPYKPIWMAQPIILAVGVQKWEDQKF